MIHPTVLFLRQQTFLAAYVQRWHESDVWCAELKNAFYGNPED